jgi:hypothetical protein
MRVPAFVFCPLFHRPIKAARARRANMVAQKFRPPPVLGATAKPR